MVDALVSGASVERRVGSSPILGTKDNKLIFSLLSFCFYLYLSPFLGEYILYKFRCYKLIYCKFC